MRPTRTPAAVFFIKCRHLAKDSKKKILLSKFHVGGESVPGLNPYGNPLWGLGRGGACSAAQSVPGHSPKAGTQSRSIQEASLLSRK